MFENFNKHGKYDLINGNISPFFKTGNQFPVWKTFGSWSIVYRLKCDIVLTRVRARSNNERLVCFRVKLMTPCKRFKVSIKSDNSTLPKNLNGFYIQAVCVCCLLGTRKSANHYEIHYYTKKLKAGNTTWSETRMKIWKYILEFFARITQYLKNYKSEEKSPWFNICVA